MSSIDDAVSAVAALGTSIDAVIAERAMLKGQLAAALANAIDPAKLQTLVDSINASVAKLKTVSVP